MTQAVIVVGGYGRAGRRCVRELLETTRARVVVAGRNAQLAERTAREIGERATARYVDAADLRTLHDALDGAAAVVACSAGPPLALLERALERRVPFVAVTTFGLESRERTHVAERAWRVGIPVVLGAGALPGLPGVVADYAVRRFDALDELRIASTGPWLGSDSARRDVAAARSPRRPALRGRRHVPLRWRFAPPAAARRVRPAPAPDLEGFREQHCVEHVSYLEPSPGAIRRQRHRSVSPFALVGEAFTRRDADAPELRVELGARDAAAAAASTAATVVRSILSGRTPAGLLHAREALNPGALLDALAKRGVSVAVGDAALP